MTDLKNSAKLGWFELKFALNTMLFWSALLADKMSYNVWGKGSKDYRDIPFTKIIDADDEEKIKAHVESNITDKWSSKYKRSSMYGLENSTYRAFKKIADELGAKDDDYDGLQDVCRAEINGRDLMQKPEIKAMVEKAEALAFKEIQKLYGLSDEQVKDIPKSFLNLEIEDYRKLWDTKYEDKIKSDVKVMPSQVGKTKVEALAEIRKANKIQEPDHMYESPVHMGAIVDVMFPLIPMIPIVGGAVRLDVKEIGIGFAMVGVIAAMKLVLNTTMSLMCKNCFEDGMIDTFAKKEEARRKIAELKTPQQGVML